MPHMNHATQTRGEWSDAPVRALGGGLRAKRGVHLAMRTVREAAGQTPTRGPTSVVDPARAS